MTQLRIREMLESDLNKVQLFTDQQIGHGYYKPNELEDILNRSIRDGLNCSFVLTDEMNIFGIRLSFPPGQWQQGKGKGISPNLWPHPHAQTGYFQSLFIAPPYQGVGWGKKLSLKSIESLVQLGCRGVLCHSWKESPDNSSSRYLKAMGFTLIQEHPRYWSQVPYQCTRCSAVCECTAYEMYLNLNGF